MHKLSGPAQRRGSRAVIRLVSVAAITAAMALSAPSAKAFSPELEELFGHFLDCKLLLLTDLEAHARECGGGTVPNNLQSLAEPVASGAAPVQSVPTPPEDEEDDCDGHSCECKEHYHEQMPA